MNDVVDSELLDLQGAINDLRQQNADRYNPVRFRMLEVLLRRTLDKSPALEQCLQGKVKTALQRYQADWKQAQSLACEAIKSLHQDQPELTQLLEAGDLNAVLVQIKNLERDSKPSPLSQLLVTFAQRTSSDNEQIEPETFEALLRMQEVDALKEAEDEVAVAQLDALLPAGELRALQEFREAWAKRSTEKAVAKALDEAPEDAGPLNSHRLIVRSLRAMQDISPEYLGRFVNQIESLLWLEQAGAHLLAKQSRKPNEKSKPSRRRR